MKLKLLLVLCFFFLFKSMGFSQYHLMYTKEERLQMSTKLIEDSPYVLEGIVGKIEFIRTRDYHFDFYVIEVKVKELLKGKLIKDQRVINIILPRQDHHNPINIREKERYLFLLKKDKLSKRHSDDLIENFQLFKNEFISFAKSRESFSLEGWYGFYILTWKNDELFSSFLSNALKKQK